MCKAVHAQERPWKGEDQGPSYSSLDDFETLSKWEVKTKIKWQKVK